MTRLFAETASAYIDLINNNLRICDWMFNTWTEVQRNFVCKLISHVKYTKFQQSEIAEQLNLKPQDVNDKIQRTGILSYIAVRKNLSIAINTMIQE